MRREETKTFFVRLPLPPSVNNMFPNSVNGKRVRSEAYKEWAVEAAWDVIRKRNLAKRRNYLPDPPYSLSIDLFFPDARRRDASNYIKAVEDLLSQYLEYDDTLNYELHVRKRIKKHAPRVEVTLSHMNRQSIEDE